MWCDIKSRFGTRRLGRGRSGHPGAGHQPVDMHYAQTHSPRSTRVNASSSKPPIFFPARFFQPDQEVSTQAVITRVRPLARDASPSEASLTPCASAAMAANSASI